MSVHEFPRRTPLTVLLAVAWFAAWAHCQPQAISDDDLLELKQRMVRLVNEDRAKEGLTPVEFDPLASRIGDIFCRQALKEGVYGHYLLDGSSPFHRYSLWGQSPHYSAENVGATKRRVRWTKELMWETMVRYEEMMMGEKPPNDGHRKNILNPWRTHLGVGLAFDDTGMRMVHEFVNKYAIVYKTGQQAKLGEAIPFAGRVSEPDKYDVSGVWVFYDPPPKPITLEEANRRLSYTYPDLRRYLRPILPPDTFYADDKGRGEVEVSDDGEFSVNVPQFAQKPGIYGLMLRIHPKGDKARNFPATYFCIEVKE